MQPTREPGRVIVVGAGAIGAAIGALLFEAGERCILVARHEHGRAIADLGVTLQFFCAERRIFVPTVFRLADAAPGPRDLVLLATMGQDTETALAGLDPAVMVASFQNGLAPLETIARAGRPTLAAMLFVPAERRAPGVIALPAVPTFGTVLVGDWPNGAGPTARWLAARLRGAGFRSEFETDIGPWLRAKLLTNLGGIVAALCDVAPMDVVEAAQAEAQTVWRAMGMAFHEVSTLMARVGPMELLPVAGRQRAGGSTRAALARGGRLETAYLHGSIISEGQRAHVPTPVNDALVRLAVQAARERWSPGLLDAATLRKRVGLKAVKHE